MDVQTLLLCVAFLLVALVYAAVGQAGATGYIALMGLMGFSPATMKTTALSLNIVVAAIGTAVFLKAGGLTWRYVWPFAVLGFPFSVLGGATHLPEQVYFPVVGVVLILSSVQMGRTALGSVPSAEAKAAEPPIVAALATGAAIGFISGITGTGGGVFLAPIILGMNWGTVRQTTATTAVYNLMNSAAALIGAYSTRNAIPRELLLWLICVVAGGSVGAYVGSRFLPDRLLRTVLSLLLLVSGLKLLF
ncbi:sulfite exporter TauE/SafE family protein [Rhizobium sp. SIMBA_035]